LAPAEQTLGRIAAENIPLAVREGNAMSRNAGTHADATRKRAAKRSLLMGNRLFLKLTRLVRS